ncbi:MAG: hypothetical protein HY718_02380 [Planctomycetes bacterium]|nr:hypothetical protein [Planctomycetota bacterium]
MPSFFARKYMRDKAPPTERRVGVFVLVLLGFIIAVFLLTGGLLKDFVNAHPALVKAKSFFGISENPLFTAAPENMPQPPPPHEIRVAQTLLPSSLGQTQLAGNDLRALPLRSDADAQAARDAGVDADFLAAVRTAGARWVYTRAYAAGQSPGISVDVADLGDPARAAAACKSRTPSAGRPLTVGRAGWLIDSGRLAGFWSGRYYTEIRGDAASAIPAETAARSLASLQLNYGVTPALPPAPAAVAKTDQTPPAAKAAGVARFAEPPGGKILGPTKIERYAENLYEKIDGKESAFRAFFVVDLKFGQYTEPDRRQSYDVYIYDMAAPANALGIYMSERVATAPALAIGRDGYASGTSIFFWKGPYYVNVLGPPDGGDATLDVSKQIAHAVAETIADDAQPFWADKALPSEDRVPNSFSYQAINALGYGFLQRMWSASYDMGGKRLNVYLTKAADADMAKATFKRFANSVARYDKVLSREAPAGGELILTESPMPNRPSKFGAAFRKGPYFGGVADCPDREFVAQHVRALFDRLSATDAGDPAAATVVPVKTESSHDADSDQSAPTEGQPESTEGNESGY